MPKRLGNFRLEIDEARRLLAKIRRATVASEMQVTPLPPSRLTVGRQGSFPKCRGHM